MLAVLVATFMTATAQEKKEDVNERMFNAKVRELVYRLNITDEQKTKFVPIYRRYNDEMKAAWGKKQKPEQPKTSEEAATMAKRKMERQQRAQAIRIKYIDELAKVLDPKQVNRFFDVESQIQRKTMMRKHNVQKKGPQKNKPQDRKQLQSAEL